jgi:hypothetical protein
MFDISARDGANGSAAEATMNTVAYFEMQAA